MTPSCLFDTSRAIFSVWKVALRHLIKKRQLLSKLQPFDFPVPTCRWRSLRASICWQRCLYLEFLQLSSSCAVSSAEFEIRKQGLI
jgi:hypothetical protein